jgi:hypothetical protein
MGITPTKPLPARMNRGMFNFAPCKRRGTRREPGAKGLFWVSEIVLNDWRETAVPFQGIPRQYSFADNLPYVKLTV